jgi:predicted nucleic acid-binding protein
LIVADSSYIVESLLASGEEFERDTMVTSDLAIHEVANAMYVQQYVLNTIKDGLAYVDRYYEAVEAGALEVVSTSKALVGEAFEIASRNGEAIYDCIFVALALSLNSELRTIDKRQARIFENERSRRSNDTNGSPGSRGSLER